MPTPDANWRSYLSIFCGLSAAVIVTVAGLNYVVDPYLTHQWDTPQVQRLRPQRERLSAWGKTYAVARYRPSVVYIGNSRTELGLPTDVPMFAGRGVFNSALSGASVADAIAMARHAVHASRLSTVVWGIDAPSFSMENGNTDLNDDLVADGHLFFVRRGLLNIKRALTVDMTRDSLALLMGRYDEECRSSLAFHGQRDDACIDLRIGGWGGTKTAVVPRTREFIRGSGPSDAAMQAFETSITELCNVGTQIRLYVNPTHAMMFDALYWAGKWMPVEAWQRALAEMGARRRQNGCDVRVYDFSGFNSITTEAIPQASLRPKMVNYWETSHYRDNVGRMILTRLFDGPDKPPADFGVELLPATISAHLAMLRAGREQYHSEHPLESALAKSIADRQKAERR